MKWSDVLETDTYKSASIEAKLRLKRNFAAKYIINNPNFQQLEAKQQHKKLTEFLKIREQDNVGISNSFISKQIRRVSKELPHGSEAIFPLVITSLANMSMEKGDAVIEKIAQSIEDIKMPAKAKAQVDKYSPKFLPGSDAEMLSIMLGVFPGFTKGLASEMLRFVKPSTILLAEVGGKTLGFGGKMISKTAKAITPRVVKTHLKRFFTVGRGLAEDYLKLLKEKKLADAEGARESIKAAESIFYAQKPMTIKKTSGGTRVIRKGNVLPQEQQMAAGRVFRNDIDVSGVRPLLPEVTPSTATQTQVNKRVGVGSTSASKSMFKNIEAEVAFNPNIPVWQEQLDDLAKALRSKKLKAESQIGKVYQTDTGFIEEAVGMTQQQGKYVKKYEKLKLKSGKDIITKPIAPLEGDIPASLLNKGEDILRTPSQVSKFKTIHPAEALSRKALLKERKRIRKLIADELESIELGIRLKHQAFDKKITDKIINHSKYKELSGIVKEARELQDKWSMKLVESGIPNNTAKKVIEKNIGSYMARLYNIHLEKSKGTSIFKFLRERVSGLKARKELSESVMAAMGVRREPVLAVQKSIAEISSAISTRKVLQAVADNPEWIGKEGMKGFTKMADVTTLGPLKGKWVVDDIARDINSTFITLPDTSLLKRVVSGYNTALSYWKYGKVVLNPPTHLRNMIANTMLLDLSGVSHAQQLKLMPMVLKEYLGKSKLYKQALKDGAFGGEWFGGEVQLFKNFYLNKEGSHLDKIKDVLKIPFREAGKMYQAEEQIAKFVKYIDILNKTGNSKLAATEAQKWLFDYSDIPTAIKVAKHIAPFVTFTYKATPRIVESMVNNPLRVYKYYAFFNAFNETSRESLGLTPYEFARSKNALPPWQLKEIGGFPTTILLPYKDNRGREQWMNLTYILPVGMVPDVFTLDPRKSAVTNISSAIVGNPFVDVGLGLITGKDFRDKDIIPFKSTPLQAAKSLNNFVYQQLAPSLAPNIPTLKGGYSWEKIWEALNKTPDPFDKDNVKRELTPTILDTLFGFKVTPVDVNLADKFTKKRVYDQLLDLKIQRQRRLRERRWSDDEIYKIEEEFFKKEEEVRRVLENL